MPEKSASSTLWEPSSCFIFFILFSFLLALFSTSHQDELIRNSRGRSSLQSPRQNSNHLGVLWTYLVAQMVKNLPAMQETWVQSLGQGDLLEKEMDTYSTNLAWRIPWTGAWWGCRVRHDWATDTLILVHPSEPKIHIGGEDRSNREWVCLDFSINHLFLTIWGSGSVTIGKKDLTTWVKIIRQNFVVK